MTTPIPDDACGRTRPSSPGSSGRGAEPRHARLARAVEVRVENRHLGPVGTKRERDLHGERALADSALAGADGEHVADATEACGDARALGDHLCFDVRAAVAADVEIALHVASGGGIRLHTRCNSVRRRKPQCLQDGKVDLRGRDLGDHDRTAPSTM
jgi:hypothetical protein